MNILIPKNNIGDRIYSYLDYLYLFKKFPAKNTFNKFIIEQKLNNKNFKLKEQTTDKYLCKKYLKKNFSKYLVPTLCYASNVQDLLNFKIKKNHLKFLLKEKTNHIIIKPTNSQGRLIIVEIRPNVSFRDILSEEEIEKITTWFSENYYISSRDRCYANLKPGFIVEPVIDDNINIRDFKLHMLNGKTKVIQLDVDRRGKKRFRNLYSPEFKMYKFSIVKKWKKINISKPKYFEKIKKVAESIAKNFYYCRVDMYIKKDNSFYIGEITHHHGNGTEPFFDEKKRFVKSTKKEIQYSKYFLG